MTEAVRITGGAGPEVAAAIAAVVDHLTRQGVMRAFATDARSKRSPWATAAPLLVRPDIRPQIVVEPERPAPPPRPS